MKMKGKVTSEELMQLAERNIPAFKILQSEFGLTKDQLGKIGDQGLDVDRSIKAIVDTLGRDYAGAMQKASDTWSGAWSTIEDIWTIFKKTLMDSGPWDFMVEKVREFRDAFSESIGSDETKTTLKEIGGAITDFLEVGSDYVTAFGKEFSKVFAGIDTDTVNWARDGKELMKDFFKFTNDAIFTTLEVFGEAWNSIIDLVQAVNFGNWFSKLLAVATATASGLVKLVGVSIEFMLVPVGEAITFMGEVLEKLQSLAPKAFGAIGIDPEAITGLKDFGQGVASIGEMANNASTSIAEMGLDAGEALVDMNSGLEGMKVNTEALHDSQLTINEAIDGQLKGTIETKDALDENVKSQKDYLSVVDDSLIGVKKIGEEAKKLDGTEATVTIKKRDGIETDIQDRVGITRDRNKIQVEVTGEDLLLSEFYKRIIEMAIDDATAKGIMVVKQ
jgi:hypothetical protein